MGHDFTKFKELLEKQEKFPLDYLHKFVGKHTSEFRTGAKALENQFHLKLQSERLSSNAQHLSFTFIFNAQNSDQVVDLLRATYLIDDLIYIL
jgi:putative lipoic acid-binding regulatory protein